MGVNVTESVLDVPGFVVPAGRRFGTGVTALILTFDVVPFALITIPPYTFPTESPSAWSDVVNDDSAIERVCDGLEPHGLGELPCATCSPTPGSNTYPESAVKVQAPVPGF